MTDNNSPRPSSVLMGFAGLVIASCVVPVGVGIDAQQISDPITNWIGLFLILIFGALAFAQYVAVFRRSRFFASVAIILLVLIDIGAIFVLAMAQKGVRHDDVTQRWIRGIALMTLVYACTVVLTYRWQTKLIDAPLSQNVAEPAKNLQLFDLFAITTFAAGLMAFLSVL